MRISDWSSDVCSSDLHPARCRTCRIRRLHRHARLRRRRGGVHGQAETRVSRRVMPQPNPTAAQAGSDPRPALDLRGRTVFVTGSSRGIGAAIALRCAEAGANVVVTGKTSEPPGKLPRSEEHTSELQSLMRNSYAVFFLKKK